MFVNQRKGYWLVYDVLVILVIMGTMKREYASWVVVVPSF
jgi:hypothetical protein